MLPRAAFMTVLALPVIGSAQGPATEKVDFQTRVGSFKILGANERPAEGDLVFSFKGTVLVSGLKGTIALTGDVRKEHEDKAHEKTVYFGKGSIRIRGKFRAVQFFGTNMKGSFDGWGVARLYGEFDKNLETGTFTFPGQPPAEWGTGGRQLFIPRSVAQGATLKPKIRKVGG